MNQGAPISPARALSLILDTVQACAVIDQPLCLAVGQYLAADVASPVPSPLFDNSAMDGYAVRVQDVAQAGPNNPVPLKLAGVIAAGDNANGDEGRGPGLAAGEAIQVFTGAMVPPGTEAVVRQEDVEVAGGRVFVRAFAKAGHNVRIRGEEIQAGDIVLKAGAMINAAAVGLLAGIGLTTVPVFQKPRVGLVVTGSELVEAGETLSPGSIYNSNQPMLAAALGELNITPHVSTTCADNEMVINEAVKDALEQVECLIVSGGVSVGDFDFVKEAAAAAGVDTVFWKVAQKPGKPLYFGRTPDQSKLVFGLPGNPASALTCFYEYVAPALRKMMGALDPGPLQQMATLAHPYERRAAGLLHFLKGSFSSSGDVVILDRQGSHMMSTFATANCLVVIPADVIQLKKGDEVMIHRLD